ncbi:MAG TPA: hypothetical protein VML57_13050 [Burkholderiales bacterium]|nr:hypothetical protein [Burkholderiales bacterium]
MRLAARIALLVAGLALAACATAPEMDGGIVGTGNRIDCERASERAKRSGATLPEECRPGRQ